MHESVTSESISNSMVVIRRFRHSDNLLKNVVWCAGWNFAGTLLASCGNDRTIKIWKTDDLNSINGMLKDHEEISIPNWTIKGDQLRTIRFVAFSPCGKYIASASFDASTIIYEFRDGEFEELHKLEGHESEIKCCAFSASGEFFATSSRDKTVWIWQVDNESEYELVSIMQVHTADVKFVAWHPSEDLVVSGGYDGSIRFYIFDGEDWISEDTINDAHEETVWSGAFDADGNHFVSVGGDHAVRIWKRNKGAENSVRWPKCVEHIIEDTQWPLYSVDWNHTASQSIAVGGGDCILRIFSFDPENECIFLINQIRLTGEINCLKWRPINNKQNKDNDDEGAEKINASDFSTISAACDDGIVYIVRVKTT